MYRELVLEYKNKHPEYDVVNKGEYFDTWCEIAKGWNDRVIALSDEFLYDDYGTVKGKDGCIYLNVKGDCNYCSWNNAFIYEFEAFKYPSEVVFAPLVFDDPEEYWAFVVKVKNKIEGLNKIV